MDLRIHVTDAAISLTRASKTEEMWTKNSFILVFFIRIMKNRARRKRCIVRDFSKNARTYEDCSSMEEQWKKTLPTMKSRCLEDTISFSTSLIFTKRMLGREKAVKTRLRHFLREMPYRSKAFKTQKDTEDKCLRACLTRFFFACGGLLRRIYYPVFGGS